MRYLLPFVMLLILLISPASQVHANIAGQSAVLTLNSHEDRREKLVKSLAMKRVMDKYNAPLESEIDTFLAVSQKYDLNPYLLPSISGVESSFGNAILNGSHNPFGWGGGYIFFDDWSGAIDTVGSGLRYNYINQGAVTVEQIGSIYAASPTWSQKVRYFLGQFEAEEAELRLYFDNHTLEL